MSKRDLVLVGEVRPAMSELEARYAFASTVIAVRRAAGLNQRQLADLTGVPQREISRIERGFIVPTTSLTERILRPLGWATRGTTGTPPPSSHAHPWDGTAA